MREVGEVEADRVFQGSIPALYDEHLGPLIFVPYADDLASRLADIQHGRILETAAGTGVLTRALVSSLPESVSIVATDLNQPIARSCLNPVAIHAGELAEGRCTVPTVS